MKNVTAEWALQNSKNIKIIDVRTPQEYANGHIEGSQNIPTPGVIFNSDHLLNKEEEYYLICKSGSRSSAAAIELEKKGFKVINVEGGNEKIGLA